MFRLGIGLNNQLPLDLLRDAVHVAEECDYDTCWVTEGIGKEAPTILADLAGRTSKIRLGTGILPVYTRTASLMAQLVLSMDEITQGRFVLGLGAGHGQDLWKEHGVSLKSPFQRLRDYVHIIRESVTHGKVSYEEGVAMAPNLEFRIPLPDKPAPIYLAALMPKMARLAGEIADGVLFNMATPEYLSETIHGVKDAAIEAGRDPAQVDIAYLVLTGTGSSGEELCARMIARYLRLPFYEKLLCQSGFAVDVNKVKMAMASGGARKAGLAVSERMLDALAIVGNTSDESSTPFELYL